MFAPEDWPLGAGPQSTKRCRHGSRYSVGRSGRACAESTIAIFDRETGELTTKRVVGRPHELLAWLRGVTRPARAVYEAGPTGYGLARRARAEGIEVAVCAPTRTDRGPTDGSTHRARPLHRPRRRADPLRPARRRSRVTDNPANGHGRAYLVERELELDGMAGLWALVDDYLAQCEHLGAIPMACSPRAVPGEPAMSRGAPERAEQTVRVTVEDGQPDGQCRTWPSKSSEVA